MLSRKLPSSQPVLGSEYERVDAGLNPGAVPADAVLVSEKYCGLMSCLIAVFGCPFIACCPQDTRAVYVSRTGQKWTLEGEKMSRGLSIQVSV